MVVCDVVCVCECGDVGDCVWVIDCRICCDVYCVCFGVCDVCCGVLNVCIVIVCVGVVLCGVWMMMCVCDF